MMGRALPLALSAATRDVSGIYRRAKRNAVLTALAGLCFVSAYVAGMVAAGAYLAPIYGPAGAALTIAAAMVLAGVMVLAVLSFLKHRDRKRNIRRQAARRLTAAAALSLLPQITKSRSLLLVAALGGAALLAAQGREGAEES
ncbi:hypothetical protein [Roseibium aggregatum]|uniref:Uncharacterized protein n=1 Tax=Roseibium aggregatum TaxID=187304 RepID=A0A939EA47_9HYPH|nr:hypothetical protein [Roseibium aggregatum]MBN9669422.1 hypothetical protein [Roseibium aggregatum]